MNPPTVAELEARLASFHERAVRLRTELAYSFIGQEGVVELLLLTLLAEGHALLEGVPGLGKTTLVKGLATALDLSFQRIQFTPDLMPADILGRASSRKQPAGGTPSASSQDRSSRTSFWLMRSTALRLAPNLHCSRRCRSNRSRPSEKRGLSRTPSA